MASTYSNLFVVVLLLRLTFTSTSTPVSPHHKHQFVITPLILETCKNTPDNDLCVDTLSATTKASDSDLSGLAAIAVEASIHQATKSAGHASNLLKKDHPPTLQQCISDCSEIYEDVVEQLNDVIGALDKPELLEDSVDWISAAMSDVDTCEEGCNSQAVEKNVLTQWNSEFKKITNIAMAIVKLLPMENTMDESPH